MGGSEAPAGLPGLASLSWGAHLCQFYADGADVRDTLVPYFKAGLDHNEKCLWVAMAPFGADDARAALRAAVGDLDHREKRGQIEIHDGRAWYGSGSDFTAEEVVYGLLTTHERAIVDGHAGLRTSGNCAWVGRAQWPEFQRYEGLVTKGIARRRVISLCSYCLAACQGGDVMDVMRCHHVTLARGPDRWDVHQNAALQAAARATAERAATEDRQQALIRELDHRVKNMLATLQAIMATTIRRAASLDDFNRSFTARVGALSKTQSLLAASARQRASLRELLANELDAHAGGGGPRIAVTGPEVEIPAHLAMSLGMAIHELASNAARHGALSVRGARLSVTWREVRGLLELHWMEYDVPSVRPPERTGFGTQLLTRVLPGQHDAEVELRYEPDGLKARIRLPLGDAGTAWGTA
jgi:two-component sensor histidine kinase